MKEAIEVLNNESLRIVLVVDKCNKLVGTITDGDVRRALLHHISMDTLVSEIMHTTPKVISVNDDREQTLRQMQSHDLLQLPIVDANGCVVGLETLQHLFKRKRYDNPVFLMAGGFGKRLLPLTKYTPKPMLNIGSSPILETIIKQFIDAGFHNFYISTHYRADTIKEYFGDGGDWNVSIQYIHEEEPLGTAGALGLLPKNIPNLPVLMMNGDLLTNVDFFELLSFHTEYGSDATVCVREYDFQVPYGVIQADKHRIVDIVEKPVQKFFVNAGIYVLNKDILKNVDGKEYLDMPQLLSEHINNDKKINMFPLHEYWLDIGQMEQFERAQTDLHDVL